MEKVPNGEIQVQTPAMKSRHHVIDNKGTTVVACAKQYLGCKYRAGGIGPSHFDCSGFTFFIYQQFGIELYHSSAEQYNQGSYIKSVHMLRPGDLVFWRGRDAHSPRVGHVGIVVEADEKTGHFKFIHSATHGGVRFDDSEAEYYKTRYVGARRVLE
ncbi:MAG: C40 family peptidase [Bacteroidales bacterium]|nr:C40 family peptidase [Bacteroidales bacterium]